MSLENQIQSSPDEAAGSFCKSKKHLKISYTRDFLLSLSELDVCRTLPSGFDPSILSEFEDASNGIHDRHRIPGSLPLQSYRRTEYSSSPPSRGDLSNYSRGVYGRWDNRSSGWSDRDSDSKSDWDSESGKRSGNQSRQSGQSPEHDGLLGSGSFPRPSGYAAGSSAPKVRSNDHYQLNRSNEPYHPPRPYKAVPHSRRDTNDSLNDETFGSTEENTSQDRAEEERRRRVSFELMRKEQQKALQEKQKLNPEKHKDDRASDITEVLEDNKDGRRVFNRSNELDEPVTQPVSNNETSKSSLQAPAFRPLVPPGFRSTILERNSGSRSVIHSHSTEVGRPEIEESLSHAKAILQNGTLDNQEERQTVQKMGFRDQRHEHTSIHTASLNKCEQAVDSSADLVDNQLHRTSSLSEASETLDSSEIIDFDTKKVTGHKIVSDSKQDHSTSILEKLFGSALTVNLGGSSGFIEHHDTERDDKRSPSAVQSSKFAHWFFEDEKKAAEDPSYARPSDLLSLLFGSEKSGSQVSDVKATQHIPPDLPFQNTEFSNSHMPSSTIGISEHIYNSSNEEAVSAILTCEDLEQTILTEYTGSGSTLQAPVQSWGVYGAKTQESKADIDDRASQHLLSLLQKGTGLKDITQSPNDGGSSANRHVSEGAIVGTVLDSSREEKAENIHHSGKTLTLETLFGSAFMKELQSVEAPVSTQRGSVGSARIDISEQQGLSFGVTGDGLVPSSTVGIVSNRSNHEINVLQSSLGQKIKSHKIENWSGFDDTRVEVDPAKRSTDVVSKLSGFDGAVDIQLPEEESLITVGVPLNTPNSLYTSAGDSTKGELLFSNKPVDIVEKLAALNTVFKDERAMVGQECPPFVRGPYDPMEPEIPYRNLHAQPSSPHFHPPHPPQMNHGRPFFRTLDSHPTHLNSQMNFMPPEGTIHDSPPNHQFPANMLQPPLHHSNTGPAGFELPPLHPMLQQMQTPGNFPPHLLQEFPRGGPLPPHPSNQATGFLQEPNQMQGFPFRQQQPNFGGLGMPLSASDVSGGSNHPEAFQRLLEMELRAKSKQIRPFAGVGHNQGMYGHELDMGFRYR